MSKDYLLIIDGSSLLSTQFYGNLPREVLMAKTPEERERFYHKIMKTSTGVFTNGIYGFLRALFKIMQQQPPAYLAVTWDLTRDTFRRELYADYKANRSETMPPLVEQFAKMQEILGRMGIRQFMDMRYEADDFSGTLARKFEAEVPVCILTKDHDYLQLASENTTIWMLLSAQKKADELFEKYHMTQEEANCPEKVFPLTPELVKKEYGVPPASIAALKGLMGDNADNIKGVPGVGPATAVALIAHYGSIEALYEAIDADAQSGYAHITAQWKQELSIKRNPLSFLLKENDKELVGRKAANLSRQLATICTDLPVSESLADLKLAPNWQEADRILRELEITSLHLPAGCDAGAAEEKGFKKPEHIERIADLARAEQVLCGEAWEGEWIGIFREVTNENTVWWLANGHTAYGVEIGNFLSEELLSQRLEALAKRGMRYAVWDFKAHLPVLPKDSRSVFDLCLADYLLRPLTTEHGPLEVAAVWFENRFEQLSGAQLALFSLSAREKLDEELASKGLTTLYETIELPLVPVLYEMEKNGIGADYEALVTYGEAMVSAIEEEQAEIYRLAGETFNINSPKQLGEILFVKLKLPYGKKTKSGYSTASDILEKLQEEYEIVRRVLHYRQLTKLKSTYVDGMKDYIREDGRIHSSFNQMITATGRLSSTEPNLQNIPIRFALGRALRKVFVPEEGFVFLDADYSQIELRLMAHMSGDESLIAAFQNQEDIHRSTASQVFGVPYEQVTNQQRSAAKAVNFGIIYGISSFSLGQDLNIPRKQAEEYIQNYFTRYKKVKQYLDQLVADARQNGEAKTLYGRIRPIPELSSSNFMQRAFGERVAMNMPIQGTAADIIKIAMLRVFRALKEQGLRSRLLLQVHDELLIETVKEEVEQVKKLLAEAMTHAADLLVSLEVDIHEGNNWYEAK